MSAPTNKAYKVWLYLRSQFHIHSVLLNVLHCVGLFVTFQQVTNNYVNSHFLQSAIIQVILSSQVYCQQWTELLIFIRIFYLLHHWTKVQFLYLAACVHYCRFTVWKNQNTHTGRFNALLNILEWIWSLVNMNLVKTSGFKSASEPEDSWYLESCSARLLSAVRQRHPDNSCHLCLWFQAITSFILLLLCHSEQSLMKPHCWRLSPVRVVKHGEWCQKTCPSHWIMAKLKSSDTDIFSFPHRRGY